MDFPWLKEKLLTVGIHPIPIIDSINPDDTQGFSFNGEFEEYLEALRKLNSSTVFVASKALEEDDFLYEVENRSYNDDNEPEMELEEIDLCLVKPALNKFKSKIDHIGIFKLSSSISKENLYYYLQEDWWIEYMQLSVEAVEDIEEREVETRKKMKLARQEKDKQLIKSVQNLFKDDTFCSLKTQRAMTTYALENIPDLVKVENRILRTEIQKLYDKVRG